VGVSKRVFVLQPLPHPSRRLAAEYASREAPDGTLVIFQQAPKSRIQEEKYHAMFGDIARQYEHAGRKWHEEDMKRLLVAAFKHDTKDDPDLKEAWKQVGDIELAPAIAGGGFVVLGTQTKRFPKVLASALIEWLYAFGAENDIRWTEPLPPELRPGRRKRTAKEMADQDTGEIMEATA